MSVVPRAFRRSSAARTVARFLSAALIAASAADAPGADWCCVRSGSPSQRIEKAGTPSLQSESVSALVVQVSCCKWPGGNVPTAAVIGASAPLGSDWPANSVTLFFARTCEGSACVPSTTRRIRRGELALSAKGKPEACSTFTCRSSKRPTVFAAAITVRPPAR